jgi:hypothetical protein
MKILKQSPTLKEQFLKTVEQKVSLKREAVQDKLGRGFLGAIGAGIFEFQQIKNAVKGNLGENYVAFLAGFLPDSWIMFKNALIPTLTEKLTEIDILLVGSSGVFLIEVKTWKGSFSAYRDKWKRREGNNWIPLEDSPTEQSLYHQKMFHRWVNSKITGLPKELITAPVVFPVAQWLGVKECSVPVFQEVKELKLFLNQRTVCLTSEQVFQIGEAIENFVVEEPSNSSKAKPTLRNSF